MCSISDVHLRSDLLTATEKGSTEFSLLVTPTQGAPFVSSSKTNFAFSVFCESRFPIADWLLADNALVLGCR